jgi:diguanylate cyclase (GGDEF)-like protein
MKVRQFVRDHLPTGGELPVEEWERRHRWLVRILWATVAILAVFSYVSGYRSLHILLHMGALVPLAVAATSSQLSRVSRSILCSLGLLTASALGVHVAGGVIEAHFSFFVVVALLTLYESWTVFALAVGFVLVHHGVFGMVAANQVFGDPHQFEHPWRWAAIHAVFVAAAGIAGLITWRLNEDIRRAMRATQEQLHAASTTDVLTELGNRRRLLTDLDAAMSAPGMKLTFFDLDGFKAYNDTFGHQAGDELLARLGRRLHDAVSGSGEAYRLGGDEFCILVSGPSADAAQAGAVEALNEHGEGFTIASSHGTVELMTEVATPDKALLLADQRMYDSKNAGRMSASRQSTNVLLSALAERNPELSYHVGDVAQSVEAVARELGVPEDQLASIGQAAELHDIGKVAIPDAILEKPGPLDEAEWSFVRRHTAIGERILAAAPALSFVAKLVRHSHERWDGGGYPDGLVGEAIPLGSRIVSVCDAFDAMVGERPYRASRNFDSALEELVQCAGSQFDPDVVAAFVRVVANLSQVPTRSGLRAAESPDDSPTATATVA